MPPTPTAPKRAVLYARVSGDDRHNESRNLNGQIDMCRQRAVERGWEPVAELVEDDRGASGAAFELPQLNRVRELARAGAFDVLVVRELDRLSRNLAKQLFVEEELRRAHVAIEYVLGEYPDTPEGNLMKHIRASIAEFERLKINERTVRGRRLKVASGQVLVHGRPPFGYTTAEVDGRATLAIVESEAAIVRRVFSLYLGGLSVRALQLRLSADGVPTPADLHGRVPKKRAFGQWSGSTLHNILRNETYAGTWHYGKRGNHNDRHDPATWLAVAVPAIVDRQQWEAVQERLATSGAESPRNVKHEYLMGRRLSCGHCSAKVRGTITHTCSGSYRCAAASSAHTSHAHRCDAPSFSVRWVDGEIWGWVRQLLTDAEFLEQGLQRLRERSQMATAPLEVELADVTAQLADVDARLGRLIRLYTAGPFSREELDREAIPLKQRQVALRKRAEDLRAAISQAWVSTDELTSVRALVTSIAEELLSAEHDFAFRRWVIERLQVEGRLVVDDGGKVIEAVCRLMGDEPVRVASTNTGSSERNRKPVILTARLRGNPY